MKTHDLRGECVAALPLRTPPPPPPMNVLENTIVYINLHMAINLINLICFVDTDIIISDLFPGHTDQFIVCGFLSNVTLNITVDNLGNTSVAPVAKLNSNFDLTVHMTDSARIADAKYISNASVKGYISESNQLGIGAFTSVSVQIQMQVKFSSLQNQAYHK